MPTVKVQFGIAYVHMPQARRHLQRVGISPVVTLGWATQNPAQTCTVYTSEPNRVIDVLLKPAFKRLLVPNDEGAIVVEDWA